VLGRNVPDELLNDDGLAGAGPAEHRRLAAFQERADEVHDLHTGLEDLGGRRLVGERRWRAVDRVAAGPGHRTLAVDRLADDVEDPTEGLGADRHRDRRSGVDRLHSAPEPIGGRHGDGPDPVVPKMLLHLGDDELAVVALHGERVIDLRQVPFLELDIEHRPDDLDDLACSFAFGGLCTLIRLRRFYGHLMIPSRLRRLMRFPAFPL